MQQLLDVNVEAQVEQKNGMSYLSWANAWREIIKIYPNAKYEVVKDEVKSPLFGSETLGYMVYTKVTLEELTREMWLPVMDFRNKAILKPTMVDVNKSIMRCLTKNLAMFGLGMELYAGEDLKETNNKRNTQDTDIKQQILNRLSTLAEEEKAGYRQEVQAGNWNFNQDFLDHLVNKYGVK